MCGYLNGWACTEIGGENLESAGCGFVAEISRLAWGTENARI